MTTERQVQLPTRFRRRLTLMFILVTGVVSAALITGAYVVAYQQRLDASEARAQQQAKVLLDLTAGARSVDQLDSIISATRARNGIATLIVGDDGARSSADNIGVDNLPRALQRLQGDQVETERLKIDGTHYVVAGGIAANSGQDTRIYVFISEDQIHAGLTQLRNILVGGWVLVVIVSAALGNLVARQTLRPIQEASEAARALTEGLLDTRLASGTTKDEFSEWARYFNEMASALETKVSELQEANDREKRLTADVVHDLRTPLGAMVAAASLLESELDNLDERARRPAELLVSDVKRMRDLVGDLLELARLDGNEQELTCEPVDLRSLIVDIVETNRMQDSVDMTDSTEIIVTDRIRLRRVLSNLLENAIKYGGGHASFSIHRQGDKVLIDVDDRGPGIPPELHGRIFERFYKTAISRSDGGTGLGLAIAAGQVQLLGGRIDVSNIEPVGARFRVTLPDGNECGERC